MKIGWQRYATFDVTVLQHKTGISLQNWCMQYGGYFNANCSMIIERFYSFSYKKSTTASLLFSVSLKTEFILTVRGAVVLVAWVPCVVHWLQIADIGSYRNL